jgi:hypothetical protein
MRELKKSVIFIDSYQKHCSLGESDLFDLKGTVSRDIYSPFFHRWIDPGQESGRYWF